MIKRPFFGSMTPRIAYESLGRGLPAPLDVSGPETAMILVPQTTGPRETPDALKTGDTVFPQAALELFTDKVSGAVSFLGGTVTSIQPFTGHMGQPYFSVSLKVDPSLPVSEDFKAGLESPDLDFAEKYFTALPGAPDFSVFRDPDAPIDTLMILGVDPDYGVGTNQYIFTADLPMVDAGIKVLKQVTGVENAKVAVLRDTVQNYGHLHADLMALDNRYPSALPRMIVQEALGRIIPEGKTAAAAGVAFFSAEAAASLGRAVSTGSLPGAKLMTVIKKDFTRQLVSAPIGTPVGDVLAAVGETVAENDRLIFGGPMTGSALFTLSHPVCADTDAVYIQDNKDIPMVSDTPCINCGDCIRVCPVRVPVNMLIRFLEARNYEDAADQYDLHACVECGLCSLVCVSRIPILQYIKLAKHELARNEVPEETNV